MVPDPKEKVRQQDAAEDAAGKTGTKEVTGGRVKVPEEAVMKEGARIKEEGHRNKNQLQF